MGIKPMDECKKGDIELDSFKPGAKPETSKLEIIVEQSSNKDGVTITLWKKEDDKFQIGLCNDKETIPENRWPKLVYYRDYKKDDLPWALYEACCDVYGCLPYPEAEAYNKRKRLI